MWFGHAPEVLPQNRFGEDRLLIDSPRFWEPLDFFFMWEHEPRTISANEVLAWEHQLSVRLPASLAVALTVQNGGRLLATEIDIYPMRWFTSLNQGRWAGLARAELPDSASRELMIQVGTVPGGSLVLDYRSSPRPRVRIMDHIFDGEFRDEVESFDALVRLQQTRRK